MNRLHFIQALPALLMLGLTPCDVRGDGGVVRFRETQSPFVITIFTPSEIAATSPAEISVMVQRQDSGEPILDAIVDLTFTAPASSVEEPGEQICGPSETRLLERVFPATRQQASNKLLYASLVEFDAIGEWRMQAFIKRGGESVKIAGSIPVASPPRGLVKLLPFLLLPPLMVALFAVNQGLRGHA